MVPGEEDLRKLLFSEKLSNPIKISRNGVFITDFDFLDFSTHNKLHIQSFGFFKNNEENENYPTLGVSGTKFFTFDIFKCLENQLFEFYEFRKNSIVVYSKEFLAEVSDHVFHKRIGDHRFILSMNFNNISVRISREVPISSSYLLDFPHYNEEDDTFKSFDYNSGSKTKSVRC